MRGRLGLVVSGTFCGALIVVYISLMKLPTDGSAPCDCPVLRSQGQGQPHYECKQTTFEFKPIENQHVALSNSLDECDCSLYMQEGCLQCKNCGWCINRDKGGSTIQQCLAARGGQPVGGTCNMKWCSDPSKPCQIDRKLIVFGNGPSLKGFDFHQIPPGIDTMGMNQAFRYWKQIDWYPTFYFSFDLIVNIDRGKDIIDLINNSSQNGIKKFFTRSNFYGRFPEFKDDPRVEVFESYNKGKHIVSTARSISTGNLATRFGMFMGYNKILIMGIDMNYVETIKESEKYKGVLKIKETPKDNPNYFFKGYQQAGDVYNPPNGASVHVPAFRQMFNDVKALKLKVDIYNGSPISKLKDMIPFMNFTDFVNL